MDDNSSKATGRETAGGWIMTTAGTRTGTGIGTGNGSSSGNGNGIGIGTIEIETATAVKFHAPQRTIAGADLPGSGASL